MISPVWINIGVPYWKIPVNTVESFYKAIYIGDFCLNSKDDGSGTWSQVPYAVYWNETPKKPEYSNYFGLSSRDGSIFISNASTVAIGHWDGKIADNGEVIYSRWRHDFRFSTDNSVAVDGGRDYFRTVGKIRNPSVRLAIVRDKIVVNDTLFLPTGTTKEEAFASLTK